MSIWIVLWLVLSFAALAFFGWSLLILVQQKMAWKQFAQENKLRYKSSAIMQSPEMDGVIDQYKISFFPSEHVAPEARSARNLTAIEIVLNTVLPIDGTIASGVMVPVAEGLNFKAEIRPKHKGWKDEYIAVGDDKNTLDLYLDDKRLDILTRLMAVKNASVMLIFRKGVLLLRLDIPEPLVSLERLQKIKSMLVKTAQVLELKKGEDERLKLEKTKSGAKDASIEIEEDEFDRAASELSLEIDEPEVEKPKGQKPSTKKS